MTNGTPDSVEALKAKLDAQHDALIEAITMNKVLVAQRLAAPPPPHTVVNDVTGVAVGVGGVVVGVASTAADTVGEVGTLADMIHATIDGAGTNVRGWLGI